MNLSTILLSIASVILFIILFIGFKIWQLSTTDFGYVTKGSEVYYYDMSKIDNLRVHKMKLKNVDANTLVEIENMYATDKNQVYCEGHVLEGANPNTIEKLDYALYRDGNTVYYMHIKVSEDYPHFKHDGIYSWDKSKVFYSTEEIKEADAQSFESLDNIMMFFARDKNNMYIRGDIFEEADSPSFEHLAHAYWKDKNAVYYSTDKIPGADPASFVVIEDEKNHVGKDKFRTYVNGKPIDD